VCLIVRATTMHAAARWLPGLSRKGTSASGDSKVTCEGMRAVRGLPALTSKRYSTAGFGREACCVIFSTCRSYL
jgi:hypothetical protein